MNKKPIKILIGGSPCTHWSIAQSKNRETTAEGVGWELFKNYLIAKEKFKPDFFLYENNKSASQAIKDQIAVELGVGADPKVRFTYINSALVSAQNRQRFYVTNFGDVPQPQDRGLLLGDIVQPREKKQKYRYTDRARKITGKNALYKLQKSLTSLDEKAKCLTCGQKGTNAGATTVVYPDGEIYILSPIECERLQTIPDGYTAAISDTQRYKATGNGWTAEVIIHLLNHALKYVPRGEEIVDCISYNCQREITCYEIKQSVSDFHSKSAVTFIGNKNYYVMTLELYQKVKEEIPKDIGVYVACRQKCKHKETRTGREYYTEYTNGFDELYCIKLCKKRLLRADKEIILSSMLRCACRDRNRLNVFGYEFTESE